MVSTASKSIAAIVVGLVVATSAWGYKQPTHQTITREAAGQSVLATRGAILSTLQCSGTSSCSIAYVQGVLGQAAIDEDDGVRAVSHFLDAQNQGAPVSTTIAVKNPVDVVLCQFYVNVGFVQSNPCVVGGLAVTTETSPVNSENWALGGVAQASSMFQNAVQIPYYFGFGPNILTYTLVEPPPAGCGPASPPYVCDYAIAKSNLLNALTAPNPSARNVYASQLFQNLGHVLHHVQDQAQPQHVRNDPHCDAGLCKALSLAINGLGAPSAYEEYVDGIVPSNSGAFTALAAAGPQGALNVLPTPAFTMPTDFWMTGGPSPSPFGRGLSEFDSYNFLSVGTSPMATASTLTPSPAHPAPSNFTQQVLSNTCTAPNKQPPGNQIYLTGAVVDQEGAGPASSGTYQSYSNVLLGVLSGAAKLGSSTTQWAVTQNCVTYDQAMYLLVPQALRYSAWFLDFMFRGSISATLTSAGALSITNNSKTEPLTGGFFQLYADDASGSRSPVGTQCAVNIQPNSTDTTSCVVGPLPGTPPPSGNYLLVYQGTIGLEAGLVAFATVAVDTWDANANFSINSNPNGPWSYLVNATLLTTPAVNFATAGVDAWWNGVAVPDQVAVLKNETNATIEQSTRVLVPGLLVVDPESQLATVTFTAPLAGTFNIQGEFTGADTVGNAHPVYIELNGVGLWNSAIISYGDIASFNLAETLAVGDTISFNVGTGTLGCAYCFLSTGFNATITPQSSSTVTP